MGCLEPQCSLHVPSASLPYSSPGSGALRCTFSTFMGKMGGQGFQKGAGTPCQSGELGEHCPGPGAPLPPTHGGGSYGGVGISSLSVSLGTAWGLIRGGGRTPPTGVVLPSPCCSHDLGPTFQVQLGPVILPSCPKELPCPADPISALKGRGKPGRQVFTEWRGHVGFAHALASRGQQAAPIKGGMRSLSGLWVERGRTVEPGPGLRSTFAEAAGQTI